MDQELQDKYDTQFHYLINRFPNVMYIFEVTKCCGYSTFVLVNKKGTLLDLYKQISIWFECKTMQELYIISNDGRNEPKTVPMTEMITIKDYVREFCSPIYPLPNNIVYKIYLDDGHSHSHECT